MKIILSYLIPDEIKNYFSKKGIEIILTMPFSCENSVLMHPDIQGFFDNGMFFTSSDLFDYYKTEINNISKSEKKLGIKYPHDVLFNCFKAEKYIFCNKKYIDKKLLEHLNKNYNIINVAQGYSNCSCLYLGNKCVATSDKGMIKTLRENNFEIIYIDNSEIKLKGYKNGFIGGSTVNIEDEIVFFGNIDKPLYKELKDFIDNNRIKYKHFPFPLEDYGSGIVIR